jgi:hypothetical protein
LFQFYHTHKVLSGEKKVRFGGKYLSDEKRVHFWGKTFGEQINQTTIPTHQHIHPNTVEIFIQV